MARKPTYEELEKQIKELEKQAGEQKQADNEIHEMRGFIQSIIGDSPFFLFALNADGRTILMNETMLNFLGYTMDEVKEKDYLSSFVPDADRETVSKIFRQLTKSKGSTLNSNRVIARDGRELLLEWHGRQVLKPNGEPDYFWCLGIGITMRKKAEEERERFIEELQKTLAKVKTLSGLLPICANCKKVRDDKGYWNQIELYIQNHSEAEFTYGVCPDCTKKLYPGLDPIAKQSKTK